MHELSLCESLLDILKTEAETGHFEKITRIVLEIGPLSSVEPEAMRFGFDVVMAGTLADGAKLDIVTPPAEARCLSCFELVQINDRFDPCPQCGGTELQISGGDALRIKEMEVT